MIDFDTFKKLPKNVGNLGKIIVAKGFKTCLQSKKSPNLVTLASTEILMKLKNDFWMSIIETCNENRLLERVQFFEDK